MNNSSIATTSEAVSSGEPRLVGEVYRRDPNGEDVVSGLVLESCQSHKEHSPDIRFENRP